MTHKSPSAANATGAPTGEARVDPSATPPPALWQDIETHPDRGIVLVTGQWPETFEFHGGTEWFGLGSCCEVGVFGDWDDAISPTHWMPLPAPPVTP